MAIYDWPNTRALLPLQAELRVIDNTQRTLESPNSGYVQTLAMPGARWGWSMEFGAQTQADRDAVEAMLLKLSGRQHRARLWDLKRPRPRGDIVLGGVTLGAAAAQFATTLQLAGCWPANNRLRYPSAFGNAVWSKPSATVIENTDAAPDGSTTADTLSVPGLTSGGVFQSVAVIPGETLTFSLHAKRSAATAAGFRVYDNTNAANIVAPTSYYASINSSSWSRVSVTFVVPAGCTSIRVYPCADVATGGSGAIVWGAQLTAGASLLPYVGVATLKEGDWIGLATGQLVRAVADAAASDAGVMTVDVRHMLRTAAANGSAVTLDRPAALYVRTEAGIALPRQPGLVEPGVSVEFVEVFA